VPNSRPAAPAPASPAYAPMPEAEVAVHASSSTKSGWKPYGGYDPKNRR